MSPDSPSAVEALASPVATPPASKLIAPWWHTALLIVIVLGLSAGQAHTLGTLVARTGQMSLYITSMVMEWVLVAFIWFGVRKRVTIRELVGGRWQSPEDVLVDFAIAGAGWLAFALLAAALAHAMNLAQPEKIKEMRKAIDFLIPRTGAQLAVWCALSATAGFCEELIFRGYLQRQFAALSGSVIVGVVVQAVLFGGAHGYEGAPRMAIICAMGIVLGSISAWRRSLRPAMFMHAGQDLLAGIGSRFISG